VNQPNLESDHLDYLVVRSFDELSPFLDSFLALYRRIFLREYAPKLLGHLYRDCPCGQGSGVLVLRGDEVLGFAGIIPQEIEAAGKVVSYGLSINMMVAPEIRSGGATFVRMVKELESLARRSGYEFILGFPNQNAFLPFVKLAGWRLVDEARFAEGDIAVAGYIDFLRAQTQKAFLTKRLLRWRLTRFSYRVVSGCLLKEYLGETNLIDLLESQPLQPFQGIFPYWSSFGKSQFRLREDYVARLTWQPLQNSFCIDDLKLSLLYSDVF